MPLDTAPALTRNFWETSERRAARRVPQLVLVWSFDEPERIGEALVVEGPCCVGRGGPLDDDPEPRVRPARLRPTGVMPRPWLANARISRLQLVLRPTGEDRLGFRSVGRCVARLNGVELKDGELREGDVLELHHAACFVVRCAPTELPALRAPYPTGFEFGQADEHAIVGESPASWALRDALAFASTTNRHVLLLGESGTGKELAARAVHALSDRKKRTFVARNAATLPEGLMDAELFGNVKNYPNPGMADRPGLVGEADGSTLFLDEIGDLPEKSQVHLLRVLDQDGEYQRLGEARPRRSSFRLVAATNRPLSALKHDFLARFTHRITVPSLDERKEDVPLLFENLLRRAASTNAGFFERFFARRHGKVAEPRIAPQLMERLVAHNYTHHARELDRLLWLAIGSAPGDYLTLTPALEAELPKPEPAPVDVQEVDRAQLESALAQAGGNRTKAARALGLKNRFVLLRLLKKHGLSADDDGEEP